MRQLITRPAVTLLALLLALPFSAAAQQPGTVLVSQRTAKALDLTVPPSLLLQATQMIQ